MKPIILDYIENRKEETAQLNYVYDYKQCLNIIVLNEVEIPVIEMSNSVVDMLTKTKVHQEKDDDNFLYELKTKTEVRKERDDYHISLLELKTKTFVKSEREDCNPHHN